MVAYHFPPVQGSSGVLRTLSFAKYLKDHDWDVTVLTVHPRAYTAIRDENLRMIPEYVRVVRAFALDAQKHFSFLGRYPRFLALPDRWQSWILGGVVSGLRVIHEESPDVLFSTYPIASAHVIGLLLHRLTGLPWVADFRDPMWLDGYPADALVRRSYAAVERQVFRHAGRITVTTPGTAELYRRRYPQTDPEAIRVISNGFDEETFPVPRRAVQPTAVAGRVRLLHSGVIYPQERNPECFFKALAELKREEKISASTLEIVLRASGNEAAFQRRLEDLELTDIVSLAMPLPYRAALEEMYSADGLIIFQSASCNRQIPAKVYEYLYVGKPILGITDPAGDTGRLLREMGMNALARLEDVEEIKSAVLRFIDVLRAGDYALPEMASVMSLSRRGRTAELARELDALLAGARQEHVR